MISQRYITRALALLKPTFILKSLPLLIALGLSGYLTYRYNASIRQTHQMVEHSMRAIADMKQVLLRLQDAETGQRGFVITGDEAYLAPYREARDRIGGDIDEMQSLIDKNPTQNAAAVKLRAVAARKPSELDATIEARRGAGFAAAQAMVASNAGKDDMDEIRTILSGLETRETAILSDKVDAMKEESGTVIYVAGLALLISLAGRLISAIIRPRGAFGQRPDGKAHREDEAAG